MGKNKVYYYVMIVLTVFWWASAFSVSQDMILAGFDPYVISLMRLVAALLFLALLLKLRHKKLVYRELKDKFIWLFGMSVTGIAGFYILSNIGLQFVDAGKSALINSINPGLTVLFGALIFKESLNKKRITGTVLSFFGVLIVVLANNQGLFTRLHFYPPDLLFLITGLFATFYTIFNRFLDGDIDFTVAIFWCNLISTIILIPFGLPHIKEVMEYGWVQWLEILYLGVFCGGFGNIIWYEGVMKIGVGSCGLINSFAPLFAVIVAWLFLGQSITLPILLGALLLVFGVWLGVSASPVCDSDFKTEKQSAG